MCEEKAFVESGIACGRGSPPHVREKGIIILYLQSVIRITPAHAGKSSQNEICWRRPWDHPHMCGEKGVYAMLYTGLWGSPPRMRGKGWTCSFASVKLRITPAYAGKSPEESGGRPGQRDHPRVCGEKRSPSPALCTPSGSPPRLWGHARRVCIDTAGSRITPACAGKSQGLNIFHTKRSSGPSPAAVPAGPAGSCPASRPSQFPPRMTVIRPRP